ncbi:MAG: hypothetical protein HND44_13165 [Chloroflexi bacterium]|nr:zinc dependent phospholipase C family protein [Ardenticatenaceae bacterium]MBL1129429.1 hypothetical protein [Chloroflexota bacterium]NOG35509.1 hypothetical protein [Chloroflexota bacterium]GIK57458.1 MAG: hypothetical protein BroJett015_31210 [Chloroflexota bacterium]
MQTYSHLLLTAVWRPKIRDDETRALLAGSVLPDLPVVLLSLGYLLDRRYVRPYLPDKTRCSPTYNQLYFHNPWWIAAHNSLHAPLPLFLLGVTGYLWRSHAWGQRLLWFAVGCGLHTAVDIVTHADDGPVLLFPMDWHKRFQSPISYWDPAYGGWWFRWLEHLLDVLLVGWMIFQRRGAEVQRRERL